MLDRRNFGVADSMYENDFASYQNPCRDVAVLRLYIQIHALIQQRGNFKF
ncbi:MAG: hypothetical protein V7K69_00305 [Nostoc sp.]